jgi:hypothetical protein
LFLRVRIAATVRDGNHSSLTIFGRDTSHHNGWYSVRVETFSKVRLILLWQFTVGVSPDLIDHSTKINQAADLLARTTQTHIFHEAGLFA